MEAFPYENQTNNIEKFNFYSSSCHSELLYRESHLKQAYANIRFVCALHKLQCHYLFKIYNCKIKNNMSIDS